MINNEDKQQLLDYLAKVKGAGINKVYLHWTAGSYGQTFADYHLCIKGDGVLWFTTDNLAEKKAHTYMRNTNAIGIALCCAYNATPKPYDLGPYPPTATQIENVAEATAIICKELNLPVDIRHVMTHSEAADNEDGAFTHEPYGPKTTFEKWDLWKLTDYDLQLKNGGDVLRGKVIWYLERLKNPPRLTAENEKTQWTRFIRTEDKAVLERLCQSQLEAEARGRVMGMDKKAREIAKNLLAIGLDIQQIKNVTGLTEEEMPSRTDS